MSEQVDRLEVFTPQVQENTLPQWLRGCGYLVLLSDYIPLWQGPNLVGFEVMFATTFHLGSTLDSPGQTIWFLAPLGTRELSLERYQEAGDYIARRVFKNKAHTPKNGFTSYIIPAAEPGMN